MDSENCASSDSSWFFQFPTLTNFERLGDSRVDVSFLLFRTNFCSKKKKKRGNAGSIFLGSFLLRPNPPQLLSRLGLSAAPMNESPLLLTASPIKVYNERKKNKRETIRNQLTRPWLGRPGPSSFYRWTLSVVGLHANENGGEATEKNHFIVTICSRSWGEIVIYRLGLNEPDYKLVSRLGVKLGGACRASCGLDQWSGQP